MGHSNPDSAGNDKRRGTAVAIAQLVEQHRLAFNNTIARYLPDLSPAIADHVTIAELLTMTSGLDDAVLSRPNPPTTIAGMVKLIATEHPEFKPGARFLYSNDGYILLGAIIEKVSGQGYDSYLREHIFKPAGMTHTDARVYTPARVPGTAHGYMLVGPNGQPVGPGPAPSPGSGSPPATLRDNSATPQIANPSGGTYSTVGDLLKFAQALLHHRLLTPQMTRTILIPRVNSPQPGGPPVDKHTYGFAHRGFPLRSDFPLRSESEAPPGTCNRAADLGAGHRIRTAADLRAAGLA